MFDNTKLQTHYWHEWKMLPNVRNLLFFGGGGCCEADTGGLWKSPNWGNCQSPFHCSAFICLQVNVVTKLGIKLHLQITQHLLYRWHLFLKVLDLLLQCFLITEHRNSNYRTASSISPQQASNRHKTFPKPISPNDSIYVIKSTFQTLKEIILGKKSSKMTGINPH